MEWQADYEIGHREIDRDHKMVLEILSTLAHDHCEPDLIDSQIKILEWYVIHHFEREERLMRDAAYPDLPHHRTLHDGFRDKVRTMREAFPVDKAAEAQARIFTELGQWWVSHIRSCDRAFIPWVVAKK
ncbi:Hemerythrin-like metal-binding protein [Candidatus Terasakiella magnetica]|nr:Hemerythrin-like metal-binding protein [Candidatus Terasakiella magnetica]